MQSELMELGLSRKEVEVYLVCIKSGESTANRIADIAGFARSTTYDILEKLKHNGYITSFVKNKKTYFLANNPEILVTVLDERQKSIIKELEGKKEKIKKLIPHLEKIQNQINMKPAVEVFEGKISISQILDEILEHTKYIKIIGNQENAVETIDYRTDKFRARRKEKGIKTFQILEDSKKSRSEKIDKYTEVRFLKSIADSRDAIFIYNNVTIHLILGHELSAIKVQSDEYTRAQEINFDELWKIAKNK